MSRRQKQKKSGKDGREKFLEKVGEVIVEHQRMRMFSDMVAANVNATNNNRLTNLEREVGKLKETKKSDTNTMKKAPANATNNNRLTNLEKEVGKLKETNKRNTKKTGKKK